MQSVAAACDACLAGHADAVVTAPISKEAIQRAAYDFPGHTEFLAERTGAAPLMILATERLPAFFGSGPLRVALVTAHVPLAQAPALITRDAVLGKIRLFAEALRRDFGCARPRVAVLGLNPHAGDGGVLGREEIDHIRPAIEAAQADGIDAIGPLPADGFFGRQHYREADGVLAMTHDQGLAPFKALATGAGVNVTAGLPIVRTSPDHGTAFDLAGTGTADPASMAEALRIAARIAARRAASS
jgi:4-hydroxythreonine-4-phosphate dehydrogenase